MYVLDEYEDKKGESSMTGMIRGALAKDKENKCKEKER